LAGFGTLGSALFDDVEGCTDDASLLLYRAAGALFGDFLWREGRVSRCSGRRRGWGVV